MSTRLVDLVSKVDELKANKETFVLWKTQWKTYQDEHNWVHTRLLRSRATEVPTGPGIYTLILEPGIAGHPSCSYLMYVGKAKKSLRERFTDYLTGERDPEGRPRVAYFLRKYSHYVWFCFTEVPLSDIDRVEEKLISAYIPPLNRTYVGELGRIMRAFT